MINILIVDDDKNFIDTLNDSFKMKDVNAEVEVAESAKEGLDALAKKTPSLIVLDVQLPERTWRLAHRSSSLKDSLAHRPPARHAAGATTTSFRRE